jgi:hypothetical protein
MGSLYLADYIANAEDYLELLIPAGIGGSLDSRGIQKLCDAFHQRGVCSFLLGGEPQPFFVNAMQSAGAYAFYLANAADSRKVTSEARPFYAAVGCGFWDCARAIATSSRPTWDENREYEDDFLFVWFLMKHFFLGADDGECRQLIQRHEAVAGGADAAHRDVCTAFLEKNGGLFESALSELLSARAERAEKMVAREAIPEESWSWLRYFSFEGFGLLGLAARAGLSVGTDFLHVSEALRGGPSFPFDPDAWRRIDFSPP